MNEIEVDSKGERTWQKKKKIVRGMSKMVGLHC